MTTRRGFLGAMLAACAAPAIVRSESLMKIVVPSQDLVLLNPGFVFPDDLRFMDLATQLCNERWNSSNWYSYNQPTREERHEKWVQSQKNTGNLVYVPARTLSTDQKAGFYFTTFTGKKVSIKC
jgi:hypothetical protein